MSKSDRADRLAKLACGECCVPDCRVLRNVSQAILRGEEPGKPGSGFVLIECSNSACGHKQMHGECYENLNEALQSSVHHSWRTGSSNAKRESKNRRVLPHTLWRDKYEATRSHCRCECVSH